MQYFLDSEFIERGALYPIDLISIGIVAEDGREYYAQSVEFDWRAAPMFVQEHVYPQLLMCSTTAQKGRGVGDIQLSKVYHMGIPHVGHTGACPSPTCPWRTRIQMATDICTFMDSKQYGTPELFGYYSAYDHVVFCQIFGTMMDLPVGFPMLTYDVRQWLDMKGLQHVRQPDDSPHNALEDARWVAATYNKYHEQ